MERSQGHMCFARGKLGAHDMVAIDTSLEDPMAGDFEFSIDEHGTTVIRKEIQQEGQLILETHCLSGVRNVMDFCRRVGCPIPEKTAEVEARRNPNRTTYEVVEVEIEDPTEEPEGDTTMATATTTKKKTVKVRKSTKAKASAASSKGPKIVGKTSGKNIRGTWIDLLVANEKAPKSQKMTDEQIQAQMRKEFPGRDSKEFTDVAGVKSVRRGYNRGVFTEGKEPTVQSHQYDKDGNKLEGRGSSDNGRPASKKSSKRRVAKKA